MTRLNLQFFGGRGSSGQSYSSQTYNGYDASQQKQAFSAIAKAPLGTKVNVTYVGTPSSTYTVKTGRGGKKALVSDSGRGGLIPNASRVKYWLGRPGTITVNTPKVNGKQSFKAQRGSN